MLLELQNAIDALRKINHKLILIFIANEWKSQLLFIGFNATRGMKRLQ